VDLQFLK
jgi:hypothetical protein